MTLTYTACTLWHERNRFAPAVFAVAFSTVLTATQGGLLLGMFAFVSFPIDHARADIWMGSPGPGSWELARPIDAHRIALLAAQPEVVWCEPYLAGFGAWSKPTGGNEACLVVGSRVGAGSLGAIAELTPELRGRLTEPGAVVVDAEDLDRLGISAVGQCAEVGKRRVRVVGLIRGSRGIAGAYVFCSLETAHQLLRVPDDRMSYVLARCQDRAAAPAVVARVGLSSNVEAWTAEDLSLHSRRHWLTKTRAGVALGGAAALGLMVAAVVTSQTLYAATAISLPQFAVLRALGVPRRRMRSAVLCQSGAVGVVGILLGLPVTFLLVPFADLLGARVLLPPWLLGVTVAVTMLTALLSGLTSLRSLRGLDPITLLR